MNLFSRCIVFIICSSICSTLVAGGIEYIPDPPIYSGLYFEAQAGYVSRDWEQETAVQLYLTSLQGNFTTVGSYTGGRGGFTDGLVMGYQWYHYFSVEAGWNALPDMKYNIPTGSLVDVGNSVKVRTWFGYLAFKFAFPVYYQLYIMAKCGAAYVDNRVDLTFIPRNGVLKQGDYTTPMFAFGAQYYFGWNWSINLQYMFIPGYALRSQTGNLYIVPSPNSNMITLGAGYKLAI